MSFNVSISDEARVIALKYGKNVSQGIVAMGGMIGTSIHEPTIKEFEEVMRRVLLEGVNLSPKEKMAFQNLNRTLDCMSNKI